MSITIVGTGYVGLVTGTCLADLGNSVICVDTNTHKIGKLKNGEVPFFEPGLKELIQKNISTGRLSFSSDIKESFNDSIIIFIAVGTPPLDNGEADLSSVYSVADEVIKLIKENKNNVRKILVTKSTVPVGTGKVLIEKRNKTKITEDQLSIASNPEFLREGSAIHDFFHPDRIVLGSENKWALDTLAAIYKPLYRTQSPILKTNLETSELSKYASNAFLATKISFINEISNICELTGADVEDVSKIMGMDARIGKFFLHPGPGYGGSCFPKDTHALIQLSKNLGYDLKIVKAVESVNKEQKVKVIKILLDYYKGNLSGKTFSILGLSFKPNTDDIRESSSIEIIRNLLQNGAKIKVFDPEVKHLDEFNNNKNFSIEKDTYAAAKNSDGIIVATEWNTFRELNLEKIKSLIKTPLFVDLRNLYHPEKLKEAGFEAYVIGRKLLKTS